MAEIRNVTPEEARRLAEEGALLLDVREAEEWVAGHAPDASHLPMSALSDRAAEIPQDRVVVCVCRVGGRSAAVTDALAQAGWEAINLAGGMEAWAAAGLPVVTDEGAPGQVV
jgi:rhodanese-related sulfurtransferase